MYLFFRTKQGRSKHAARSASYKRRICALFSVDLLGTLGFSQSSQVTAVLCPLPTNHGPLSSSFLVLFVCNYPGYSRSRLDLQTRLQKSVLEFGWLLHLREQKNFSGQVSNGGLKLKRISKRGDGQTC
jgi:hypothetical protein